MSIIFISAPMNIPVYFFSAQLKICVYIPSFISLVILARCINTFVYQLFPLAWVSRSVAWLRTVCSRRFCRSIKVKVRCFKQGLASTMTPRRQRSDSGKLLQCSRRDWLVFGSVHEASMVGKTFYISLSSTS